MQALQVECILSHQEPGGVWDLFPRLPLLWKGRNPRSPAVCKQTRGKNSLETEYLSVPLPR